MVNWAMLGAVLVPNMGGWASALTMAGQVKRPDGRAWYQTLKKPSWTPPAWLFGPAWTVLYSGMGYASYVAYKEFAGFSVQGSGSALTAIKNIRQFSAAVPLTLYGGQLLLNWTWTPIFFGLHKIGLGLLHILALDATAVACTVSFYSISATAGHLMLPYLAWLGFATCLNYSIWKLNKPKTEDKKRIDE